MQSKGKWAAALTFGALLATLLISPSYGLTVTAAGDSAGLCTQSVSDTTGVTVTKVGSECVVQFTSARTLTWTPAYAITARYLVVGAGASSTRGYCGYYWGQGGGGGEVLTGTGRSFAASIGVTVTVADATGRSGDCTQTAGIDGSSSALGTLIARGGKRIATCLARPTSGSYPTLTSTCTWKPVRTGRQFLTAQLTPTNNNFTVVTSQPQMIWVVKRTTTR